MKSSTEKFGKTIEQKIAYVLRLPGVTSETTCEIIAKMLARRFPADVSGISHDHLKEMICVQREDLEGGNND